MLKRLRIISGLLQEKDYRNALSEVESLTWFSGLEEHQELLQLIQTGKYQEALQFNNYLINKNKSPVSDTNFDLTGLNTVKNLLETRLHVLTNQKTEADRILTQFRIRYYQELGTLLGEILRLRLKIFEMNKDSNPDALHEYKNASRDFSEYQRTWEHIPRERIKDISAEDKHRLQKAYRKASRLCHPDVADDSVREQATQLFVELTQAYNRNEVEKVEQILASLENGTFIFTGLIIENEKTVLQGKIRHYQQEIEKLSFEIEEIRKSQSYQTILRIPDWDDYFNQTREGLEKELTQLRKDYES